MALSVDSRLHSYAQQNSISCEPRKRAGLTCRSWCTTAWIRFKAHCQWSKNCEDYAVEKLTEKILLAKNNTEKASYLLLSTPTSIFEKVIGTIKKKQQDAAITNIFVCSYFTAPLGDRRDVLSKACDDLLPSPPPSTALPSMPTSLTKEFKEVSFKGWQRQEDVAATKISLKHPASAFTLHLVGGDITGKYTESVGIVANAANDTMYYGGGGTNAAFSQVIDQETWSTDVKHYFQTEGKTRIAVSECVVFPWKPKKEYKATTVNATYFAHLLGPRVTGDLQRHQQEVYQAYKNLFQAAKEKKVDSVQIPFLSTGIFAEGRGEDWFEMVDKALFTAISEEIADPNGIREVVLVRYGKQVPWQEYLYS